MARVYFARSITENLQRGVGLKVLSGLHHLIYVKMTVLIGCREMQQNMSKNCMKSRCSLSSLASDHSF